MQNHGQTRWYIKPYGGWLNCHWLTDGRTELVLTTDVGPRIIRFGSLGGPNVLCEYPQLLGRVGDGSWVNYGGHRLWRAPEDRLLTYTPDNGPVPAVVEHVTLRVTQQAEQTAQLEKQLEIRYGDAGQVVVTHWLVNRSAACSEFAPWAITVLAQGGTAIVPLPARGTHPECLTPTSTLILWPYTDLSDPRWTWGQKHVLLRQVPGAGSPQKVGASVGAGWAAYANDGQLLVKTFAYREGARYPDLGANVEVFTNATMLELETLGPLVSAAPGEAVEHTEQWFLFNDVPAPRCDEEVDRLVLPCVREALERTRAE